MALIEVFFNSAQGSKRARTGHQHMASYENGWTVQREGSQRITSKHRKQNTAIRKAKCLAEKHKANVTVYPASKGTRERISYDE